MDISVELINAITSGVTAKSPGHLLAAVGTQGSTPTTISSPSDQSYTNIVTPIPGPFQNIYYDVMSNIQLKSVLINFNISGGIIYVECDVVLYLLLVSLPLAPLT